MSDPDDEGNKDYYDDDHDLSEGLDSRFGPYRPLHPMREGFTMGVCVTVIVGVIIWLLYRML